MAERSRWMKVLRVIFLDLKARGSMPRSVSFYKRPKLTLFFIFQKKWMEEYTNFLKLSIFDLSLP